ncbi:MAG: hypothetical protein OHK0053_26190 [Microscillaceae bacterium]
MKNLIKILAYACLCAGLAWATWSCKDKDPCTLITPFEAEIQLQTYFPYVDTTIQTDQFIQGNAIEFTAAEDYDEYLWTLEDDDRTWTTKSFGLTFVNSAFGSFDVTLVAKRLTGCPTDPVQIDTVTKNFFVHYYRTPSSVPLSQTTPLPFYGKFEGAFEDTPNDVFTVEIINSLNNAGGLKTYLYNFPKGCGQNSPNPPIAYENERITSIGGRTYTAFASGTQFDTNGCIFMPWFFGTLDEDDYSKITLSYELPNGMRRIFRGTKQ